MVTGGRIPACMLKIVITNTCYEPAAAGQWLLHVQAYDLESLQTQHACLAHTLLSQTVVSGCQLRFCQQLQGRAAILNAGES